EIIVRVHGTAPSRAARNLAKGSRAKKRKRSPAPFISCNGVTAPCAADKGSYVAKSSPGRLTGTYPICCGLSVETTDGLMTVMYCVFPAVGYSLDKVATANQMTHSPSTSKGCGSRCPEASASRTTSGSRIPHMAHLEVTKT